MKQSTKSCIHMMDTFKYKCNYATHFISNEYCSLHKVYLSTIYKFTYIDIQIYTSDSGFLVNISDKSKPPPPPPFQSPLDATACILSTRRQQGICYLMYVQQRARGTCKCLPKIPYGYMLPDACSIEEPRALASACQNSLYP